MTVETSRKVNFFIASEQHARIFGRLACRLKNFAIYRCGTPRANLIDNILKRNGVVNYEKRKAGAVFLDAINKDEVFVIPLMVGTKSHSLFKKMNSFNSFINMPLDNIKGKVAIMNEKLLHTDNIAMPFRHEQIKPGGYRPHAHVLLARTQVEASVLEAQKLPGSQVHFIGDAGVKVHDGQYREGGDMLIVTAFDPTRSDAGHIVMDEIVAHIEIACKSGHKPSAITLKPHPGEVDKTYRGKLQNVCSHFSVRFNEMDQWKLIEGIGSNFSTALVQSSLSTHFVLRSMGVESFTYSSPKEKNDDNYLIRQAGMPPCKLYHKINGDYCPKVYDEWVKKTFLADGKHLGRFLNAIE